MLIPESFKIAINKVFYTHDLDIYTITKTLDSQGGRGRTTAILSKTIKCNVNMKVNRDNLEEFGIKEVSDILISTNDIVIKDNVFKYNDITYRVNQVIKRDSHYLVGGVENNGSNIVWV